MKREIRKLFSDIKNNKIVKQINYNYLERTQEEIELNNKKYDLVKTLKK